MIAKIILLSLVLCSSALDIKLDRFTRQALSCGVPNTQGSGLIYGGDSFSKGAWPWMTALLFRKASTPKFFCAGTLISKTKVVTAAHCIHEKYVTEAKKPREIILVFGAYDLDELFQPGSYSASPSDIIIHRDWNPFVDNYDADIALLITDDDIPFTKFIQPICMWDNFFEPNVHEGFIAGWGESGSSKAHESIPKQLKIPIKYADDCLLDNPYFTKLASKRTICGGSRSGSGPCLGDSGSGLFIKHGKAFYLRGIVSSSLLDENRKCDVTNFALYTNVLKYAEWIANPNSQQTFQATTTKAPETSGQCGYMSSATSTIQGGFNANRELFPWTVVVIVPFRSETDVNYLKTGTLVSNKHVIVPAGFLVHADDSGKIIIHEPSLYKMYFGLLNLDDKTNSNVVLTDVSKCIVPSTYTESLKNFREASIGILVANKILQHSNQIYPICLWPQRENPDEITGENAYGVGWGFDDKATYTKQKKFIPMTVDQQDACEAKFAYEFQNKVFTKFFCARASVKGTPCISDDPIYIKAGSQWYIRGLSTRFFFHSGTFSCMSQEPILYEDIAFYYNWITAQIKLS